MDGIWGMEGRGPTNGEPRKLNVVLASRHPASLDATAMRLVGFAPETCRHLMLADPAALGPIDPELIAIDGDFDALKCNYKPPVFDNALRAMNALTANRFFVKYILFNNTIFNLSRFLVRKFRKIGIVR